MSAGATTVQKEPTWWEKWTEARAAKREQREKNRKAALTHRVNSADRIAAAEAKRDRRRQA